MGKKMSADQFERRLQATVTIMQFMWSLVPHYSAPEMHHHWLALGEMIRRYGDIFVADAITKSETEAELALFRYGKKVRA